jgi:hypothetical protein
VLCRTLCGRPPPRPHQRQGLFFAARLPCASCHTGRTVDLYPGAVASYRSIPGHPRWALAPLSMAWEGKSIGDICRQIKDKNRNGGRDLALMHEHVAKDDLVAYGWRPGAGRVPAPGTQEHAGELIQAWIDTARNVPEPCPQSSSLALLSVSSSDSTTGTA